MKNYNPSKEKKINVLDEIKLYGFNNLLSITYFDEKICNETFLFLNNNWNPFLFFVCSFICNKK